MAGRDGLDEEAVACRGAALVRLARSFELDPDQRQDLLQGVALGHRAEGWSTYLSFASVVAALLVCIPLSVLPGTRPLVRELEALDRLTHEA